MEPDEISVVLLRASELHTKINDAIERALKSEFLLSKAPSVDPDPSIVVARGDEEEIDDRNGALAQEPNAEAKSLGGIRDALEALEEQLECLQTLQHQQRIDRDTALAELEESRRILLNRLKNHRGKEWEIVHEALAFAGEPVGTDQQTPSPPRITQAGEPADNDEESAIELKNRHKIEANFLGIPFKLSFDLRRFAGRLFGPGIGVTSRAAMVLAGVLTVIIFSEMGSRSLERRRSSSSSDFSTVSIPSLASSSSPTSPTKAPVFEERCPPGKIPVFEDGKSKCVVKERIEIPFHGEVKSPDVLYGRG